MPNINQHHKKTRMVAVAALVIGVLGLGVAFAALSTTLFITGKAKIKTASWDIYWQSVNCVASGEAQVITTGTAIGKTNHEKDTVKIEASFKAYDDKVICTMVAKNNGSIDAVMANYADDWSRLLGNSISPSLMYAADTNNTANGLTEEAKPDNGDKFNAGTTVTMSLILHYGGELVIEDTSDITFSYTLPYVQANQ